MNETINKDRESEWFIDWFNTEASLERYAHRDSEEAKLAVALIKKQQQKTFSPNFDRCLDAGCNRGRHLPYLETISDTVLGIDLSLPALIIGKENGLTNLINADLRYLPIQDESLDLVTSFFSSWGYLPSDEDNVALLKALKSALKKDALLMLDIANPDFVMGTLETESRTESPHYIFYEKRTVYDNNRRLKKDIVVHPKNKNAALQEDMSFHEDLRLFTAKEIFSMIKEHFGEVCTHYGSYTGDGFTKDSSRLIVFCKKK